MRVAQEDREESCARFAALAYWLPVSGTPLAKLIRFGLVGMANSAVFAAITALLVSGLGVAPVAASVAGYCGAMVLGFLGHRGFSFRSHGRWSAEAFRFLVVQGVNIAITMAAMHATVALLARPYYWGMLAAVVLVPAANFLLMNFWVFRDQRDGDTGMR